MMDALGEVIAHMMESLPWRYVALVLAGLGLAAGSGFLTATALGTGSQTPTRTVTVNVSGATGQTGPTGPAGAPGSPGPPGDPGAESCPTGSSFGELVLIQQGKGPTRVWTCLVD